MKKVIGKNQVIITSLAILIAVAGKDQQRTGALTEQGRSAGHYQ